MNNFNESQMYKVEGCTNGISEVNDDNLPSQSTLVLQFSHSSNQCTATISNDEDTIISPLDIYRRFGKFQMFELGKISTKHVTITDECVRFIATDADVPNRSVTLPSYENNASQFKYGQMDTRESDTISLARKIMEVPNIDAKPPKSILKNGSLVKSEARSATIGGDIEGN